MKRVLVCGYYGFGNTGDEAILTVLLTDLKAAHPQAHVTVVSGRPASTAAEHGVDAVGWQDISAMVQAAREADLMVLGGGGLFQDQHGFDEDAILTPDHGAVGFYSGFALLARITDTPLVIYAVGVGPLDTEPGRRYTKVAFEQASAATVRDDTSLRLLDELGVDARRVTVTADPAWTLTPPPPEVAESILRLEHAPNAPATVVAALRPWGDHRWEPELADALDRLVENLDARVVFVPFQASPRPHENDHQAALQVAKEMRHVDRTVLIRGGYSVEERFGLFAAADLVVGMRLHSVIAGLTAGVPTVAVAYDPKVTIAMEQAGRGELVVPLSELTAGRLVETCEKAAATPPSPGVEELARRAALNRQVLGSAASPPPAGPDTLQALARLAGARTESAGRLAEETRRLRAENASLWSLHQYDRQTIAAMERQREELVSTRAIRAVNAYWAARAKLRDAARAAVPSGLKPGLKRLLGRTTPRLEPPVEAADPEARRRAEQQIAEVLERHRHAAGIVVYPPSIGWKTSLFQRPQQMALAFSRLGYLVFYGVDAREGIGDDLTPRDERVYLYPVSYAFAEAIGIIPQPITVSYVYNYTWTKRLDRPRIVFEHIDELEVFTTTHGIDDLRAWYDEAVTGADLVVASARDLLRTVRERRPDALLCPNGVDYRHFAEYRGDEPPEDIADLVEEGAPIVGYYGALAEWVDYPLIAKSAGELPEFRFVFIGPDYDGSIRRHDEVFELPNVRWLGVKDYRELPAYLHHFDVATIPFVVNEVTHSVSPLKLFEYMAGGRPVVTPPLRECSHYEAVQVASGPDDYVGKLRYAATVLRHDPDHRALLQRTARANTWEMRVGTLLDALARTGRL